MKRQNYSKKLGRKKHLRASEASSVLQTMADSFAAGFRTGFSKGVSAGIDMARGVLQQPLPPSFTGLKFVSKHGKVFRQRPNESAVAFWKRAGHPNYN